MKNLMARNIIAIFLFSIPCVGQTLPTAEEIRAKVAETYRAAKRYYLSGMASMKTPKLPRVQEPLPVVMAIELPDKMRMEGDLPDLVAQGFNLFILNGKKAWMYNSRSRQYYSAELPDTEKMVAQFDKLALIRYRGELKPDGTATILRTETLHIKDEDIECYVIQIDRGDFESKAAKTNRNTWWVDKDRFIVWKEENVEWLSVSGGQEIQSTFYDTVLLGEKLPKGIFNFKPPKGSTAIFIPKR